MKNKNFTLTLIILIKFSLFFQPVQAQLPTPSLVGYWHNWNDASAPYIPLTNIDARYNVIEVAFAIPHAGTDYQMEFIPESVTPAAFISQIQTLQSQGRKVLISVGGASSPVSLDNATEKNVFISSMNAILDQYGFDGFDLDLEGSSVSVSGGTIASPVDAPIINLIDAVKQIMQHRRTLKPAKLLLTMAPETAFVQGGMSAYGGIWGAYLPVIHALRDSIDLLQVQLYNSGTMYGTDHNIYTQGTADFIVAMTEAVIKGFNTAGGMFTGLPANKVAAGLPACSSAAGGGYTDTNTVKNSMLYLMGKGGKPGSYTLQQAGGYPTLKGMMTWSINWDATASCASVYQYARNFQAIYSSTLPLSLESFAGIYNPSGNIVKWTTSNQENTAYFVVEKSKDGVNFYSSDTMSAGNNSNRRMSYSYADKQSAGNNYYRLKIVSADGSFTYSAVILITEKEDVSISFYPNPATDYLIVKLKGNMTNAVINIADMQGRIVKRQVGIAGSADRMFIGNLPNGLYLLQVFQDGKRYQSKILKE